MKTKSMAAINENEVMIEKLLFEDSMNKRITFYIPVYVQMELKKHDIFEIRKSTVNFEGLLVIIFNVENLESYCKKVFPGRVDYGNVVAQFGKTGLYCNHDNKLTL